MLENMLFWVVVLIWCVEGRVGKKMNKVK